MICTPIYKLAIITGFLLVFAACVDHKKSNDEPPATAHQKVILNDTCHCDSIEIIRTGIRSKVTLKLDSNLTDYAIINEQYDLSNLPEVYAEKNNARYTGVCTLQHLNGQLKQLQEFYSGKLGPKTTWYDDGNIATQSTYENDSFQAGTFTRYFSSGGIHHEYQIFGDDNAHGKSIEYYPSGEMRSMSTFLDGWEHGLRTMYYESGAKMAEITFVDGDEHGVEKAWYENGQIEYITNYEHGKEVLPYVEYHENGQKAAEATGEMTDKLEYHFTGKVSHWDENGVLYKDLIYENGVIVDSTIYNPS